MRNELKHIEAIEKYLTGNMSAAERAVFEETMAADPDLTQQVELQQQITEGIQVNAFRQEIAAFHLGWSPAKDPSPTRGLISRRIYLNSIFGIVLLFTAGLAFYLSSFFSGKNDKHVKNEHKKMIVKQVSKENESEIKDSTVDQTNHPNTVGIRNIEPKTEEVETDPTNPYLLEFYSIKINCERDTVFQMVDSKSTVSMAANTLEDANGNPIQGEVEIRYREYRNAAQMAFSGIPMTFDENGEHYNFNSAGMFEIRAFQDGKELRMKEGTSFNVDYNATQQVENCYFFVLNEKGYWEKKRKIDFDKEKKEITEQKNANKSFKNKNPLGEDFPFGAIYIKASNITNSAMLNQLNINHNSWGRRGWIRSYTKTDTGYVCVNVPKGTSEVKINSRGFKPVKIKRLEVTGGKLTEVNIEMRPRRGKKSYKLANDSIKKSKGFCEIQTDLPLPKNLQKLMPEFKNRKKDKLTKEDSIATIQIRREQTTLLAQGSSDPGHTYPNMVKGLNCPSFGVYNCDQIYQLAKKFSVQAEYIDENGKKIKHSHVLSLVDLKFNGAFSFDPSQFYCSADGRNVLLLFTKDKRLFAIREEDFKKMNISESGEYTFTMKDITKEVKNTKDLKNFLGL